MIGKGFCIRCGRRLDADPDRPNDGKEHNDCKVNSKILKNLGIREKDMNRVREQIDVLITEEYWDCECETNYIHPKTEKVCRICGAIAEEQPNSRVNEVLNKGLCLPN